MATEDSLVRLVVGKLGSGKTWYCVMKMLDALSQGLVCVSNVKLDWPIVDARLKSMGCTVPRGNYRYVDTGDIDKNPDCLLQVLSKGSCLVLDEVHLFFNARKWKENQTKAETFLTFITQARKLDVDMYLISQADANIDAQLVRMATHIVRVTNWRHVPLLGSIFPFPLTVARTCEPDGRTVLDRDWIWRSSKVGKLYNTKQTFKAIALDGAPAGNVRGKKRKNLGYGWYLMVGGSALLAVDYIMDRRARAAADAAAANAPAAVVRGEVVAAVSGGGASPDSVAVPLRREWSVFERAAIESRLPKLVSVSPRGIVVEGLRRPISVGSYFVAGPVRGWHVERGGSVLVMIDSPEITELRLFDDNGLRSLLYSDDGGKGRGASGRGSGSVPGLAPQGGGVAPGMRLAGKLGEAVDAANQQQGDDHSPLPVPGASPVVPMVAAAPSYVAPPPAVVPTMRHF